MSRVGYPVVAIMVVAGCSSPPTEKSNGDPPVVIINNNAGSNNGGSNNGGPVITECGPGRDLCDGACVDVSIDSDRCGGCNAAACADTQVCSNSSCVDVPADCRTEGECPDRYFCDENTGLCQVGCKSNADCPGGAFCELASHACLCTEPGEVACGGDCVTEDPLSCGTTCETCPSVSNGEPLCAESACALACNEGYMLCDGKCAACPSGDAVLGLACLGDQCVASECAPGHEVCDGECAACPATTGDESLGCDGNQCIITDCAVGTKLCGGTCADCPEDPSGTAQCSGNQCVLVCQNGLHSCGDFCAYDDDTSACGPSCEFCDGDSNGSAVCENNTCGLSCDAGYKDCGGACAACPDGLGIAATRCAGASCVVQSCSAGYTACSFGCCKPPPDGVVKAWGNSVSSVSIALDSNGYPHIAYSSATLSEVRYSYWAGNQWVDEYVGGGWDADIALDSQNRAHVAIWNRNGGSADYGFRGPNGWTIEKIEQFDVGMTPAIVIAGTTVHVAYHDETREDLKYATRTGTSGTWTKSTIESTGSVGYSPSIAVDGTTVMFAYPNATDQSLRFTELIAGPSTVEVGYFDYGINSSLVLNSSGTPYIAFQGREFQSTAEEIHLAIRQSNNNWFSAPLIPDAANPVLFLDSNDNGQIVYQALSDGDVRIAKAINAWSSTDLYTTGYVGEQLDAAEAANGDIHVGFSDGTNKTLRYLRH